MPTAQRVLHNFYRDSVALMQFSQGLLGQAGVRQASAVMATEGNLTLLRDAGLLAGDGPPAPNDLLLVFEGPDLAALEVALDEAAQRLTRGPDAAGVESGARVVPPRSIIGASGACQAPTWP